MEVGNAQEEGQKGRVARERDEGMEKKEPVK